MEIETCACECGCQSTDIPEHESICNACNDGKHPVLTVTKMPLEMLE